MRYLVVAVLIVLAGAVAGYWVWSDRQEQAVAVEDASADSSGASSIPRGGEAPFENDDRQAAFNGESGEELTEEERLLEMGYTEEEIAHHRKRQRLEQQAQSRFDDTVKLDQLNAGDINPKVRELFTTMMFEPAFNVEEGREGYVDGLRIAELRKVNPFAQAGFEVGDRLVRLNGQPLRDPAQIAHLFTALNGSFEACALRSGREYCRHIELPDS